MNARIVFGIVAIAIVALGAFVLLNRPTGLVSGGASGERIVIGAIQPLTGSTANIGQNARAAIEAAVEEINSSGGINGKKLELVLEDGQCNAKEATNAATKLVEIDKVSAIVGGLCSSETMAAAPIAEKGKVVLLSNCSSNPKITSAGDYVFRDYPSDTFQGKKAAELALNTLGAKKAAILSCQSDYCAGIKEVFKETFNKAGGKIVAEEEFAQETKDMKTQLLKIKEANPELLYFVGYSAESTVGIKQVKELGISAKILGADAWDDPALWEATSGTNEGLMFTAVKAPENKALEEAMQKRLGEKEKFSSFCSFQAYDAVKLIAQAMKSCGTNSDCIKNELYKVQGYAGVSGTISFDPNGDITTASYVTKIVRNGKAVELEK